MSLLLIILSIRFVYPYTNSAKSLASPSTADFTKINDKYLPLLKLKSNNYESMTISEFRNFIFDEIDSNNETYLTLLDEAFGDEELQKLRYTNDKHHSFVIY